MSTQEADRLAALRALALTGTAPEPHYDAVCRTARALFGVPISLVSIVDEHEQWFKAKCGLSVDGTSRAVSFCAHAILSDDVLVVEDAGLDPGFAENPLVTGDPHIRFYAGAPLILKPGLRVGTLCLIDTRPRLFSAEERRRLQDLALIVVAHLQLHAASRANAALAFERQRAETALNHMRQALVMLAADQTILFFNARAPELLDLPASVLRPGAAFADIRAFQRARGDFALVDAQINERVSGGDLNRLPPVYEWPRPDGKILEVRGSPLPDGQFVYTFTDVTARNEAQAALRTSEANYRLLVDGVGDHAIYMLSPCGQVRNWSLGAQRITGYSAEEILGQHVSRFYPEQDRCAGLPEGALRTAERLGVFRDEGWRLRKGGERFWASVVIQPVRDAGGTLLGFTEITRDATQQHAAEHALRTSEARYRLLAENTSDVIIQSDLDTTRRYISPAVAAVLGYTPDTLVGTKPLDFVHPDDIPAYQAVLGDITEERSERVVTQQRYRHRDGFWVWIEVSFALTRDPVSGQATGYVATLRDISARRAAEQAAAESEARYRELKDAAHDAILAQLAEGVIVTDTAGRITLVNDASAAIHGVARLDVEPAAYSDTYHLFTEDGLPYPSQDLPLARAVGGETVEDARWRVQRPDGTEVLAIGNARPLRGHGGRQIGAVLTLRDDTARDAAERSLRASEAELRDLNATLSERVAARTREAEAARCEAERASAAKTEFLASMSHEIRTPLNGVIGFNDLLLDEPGLPPAARRYAERIQSAGATLLTVVNDILDFSKIEAGQIELVRAPFPLCRLIEETAAIVRQAAERKGLSLRVAVPPVPLRLIGDETRLRQVLLNLLNNAVKFTAAGGVVVEAAEVATTARPDGAHRIRVAVRDTGRGISVDVQPRLFQRFQQADACVQRDFGGTGLGLAISKQLVELMGGTIGVESRPGAGSTFWFEVDLPAAPEARSGSSTESSPPGPGARRLLLVDDVPMNQELARAVLTIGGHSVDVVGSGAEAVRAVQAASYDLVLMDVQMPGMDGMTATRLIRSLAHPAASVPIVAMTANVLPHQIEAVRAAGMQGHVGKPFQRAELLAVIAAHTADTPGPAAASEPGFDRQAFAEVREMMGAKGANRLLTWLARELRDRLGADGAVPDRARLAREAHALASASGLLGFAALSDLCREVEAACDSGNDYDPLVPRLYGLRQACLRTIEELLAA
ncbi:PAS domain S-box protein [Methylobacterium radiodurans]|uniref:histidine kinase n=1 Tax=Methylobacterium radiodurans TaxID=2202828 RepID=A0A2U8VXD1_9HYPH|nr:PAS domain S-box protein [Methylobacterium radiodurans]AWN38447.1 PAS domain S-box protein [Methylobacterium radiodurans]